MYTVHCTVYSVHGIHNIHCVQRNIPGQWTDHSCRYIQWPSLLHWNASICHIGVTMDLISPGMRVEVISFNTEIIKYSTYSICRGSEHYIGHCRDARLSINSAFQFSGAGVCFDGRRCCVTSGKQSRWNPRYVTHVLCNPLYSRRCITGHDSVHLGISQVLQGVPWGEGCVIALVVTYIEARVVLSWL